MSLATAHLESYGNDSDYRSNQLSIISKKLDEIKSDCNFIVMDSNFAFDGETEILLKQDYKDSFAQVCKKKH